MKFLISLCLLGVASAGLVYPTAEPDYEPRSYEPTYKMETRCKPVFDTVQEDRCEAYSERVCSTQQRESCNDVQDENCRAIMSTKQVRKCFNVTEILCGLKEQVNFETVEVGFTVQKCQKLSERVCDMVYETNRNVKEDVQCVNVKNPHCINEERIIEDKTCRTTTQFECTQAEAEYGYGDQSEYGSGSGSGGSGSGGSGSGSGDGGSGSAGGYGSDYSAPAYAAPVEPKVTCTRRQETKCYKTPRTVNLQKCSHKQEKVCERVSLQVPAVEEKQNCRNEDKKVCQLEQRSQPKQVKKYTYNKSCRPVPRSVCESADEKILVPSCVASTRKECSYSPIENCEDIPKQHCFKVNKQIRREQCEQVRVVVNAGGNNGGSSSFGGSGGSGSFNSQGSNSFSSSSSGSGSSSSGASFNSGSFNSGAVSGSGSFDSSSSSGGFGSGGSGSFDSSSSSSGGFNSGSSSGGFNSGSGSVGSGMGGGAGGFGGDDAGPY